MADSLRQIWVRILSQRADRIRDELQRWTYDMASLEDRKMLDELGEKLAELEEEIAHIAAPYPDRIRAIEEGVVCG